MLQMHVYSPPTQVCQRAGCPGDYNDCTDHGDCNKATHECTCFPGWSGDACDVADCPGSPNCMSRGYCNTTVDPPRCTDCETGWMGADCDELCVHGVQVCMVSHGVNSHAMSPPRRPTYRSVWCHTELTLIQCLPHDVLRTGL